MNAKDIGYTIAQIFLLVCLLAFGLLLVAAFDPLDAHGQELRVGVVPTVVTHHYTAQDSGRHFIGVEMEEDYARTAVNRLESPAQGSLMSA